MLKVTRDSVRLLSGIYLVAAFVSIGWSLYHMGWLFEEMKKRSDPSLWEQLGSPNDVVKALQDRKGRWRRFMRSAGYRSAFPEEIVARIERFRFAVRMMLAVLIIAGGVLVAIGWKSDAC